MTELKFGMKNVGKAYIAETEENFEELAEQMLILDFRKDIN